MSEPGAPGDPSEDVDPVADLDARALRAWVELADPTSDDGDLIMVLTDGDVTFRITSGMGGERQLASLGLERLATTAKQFARALSARERAGTHGPWNGP